MGLRSPEAYIESLRDGRRVIYRGELVPDVTAHPVIRKAILHAAIDYRLAEAPATRELFTVDEDGERVSRFYHVPRSVDDLLLRMRAIETATAEGGTVVTLVHEIGSDALFGLRRVATVMDRELGTAYLPRVQHLHEEARRRDWALAVAQTDVKGDRGRGPSAQADPDAYLRIVERRSDGIVVRGMKAHTSVSVNANALIVLPTRALTAADADYAVAFWVPVATPGLTLVASPHLEAEVRREEHPLAADHRMMETLTWFDDVFVPWEQVFLAGEWAYAGPLALAFVDFHRFTAVSYKLPLVDALVGVAAWLAELNGLERVGHVREKLARLIVWAATVRELLEASALAGKADEAGTFSPDPTAVNLAKYHFAHGFHEALRDVQDIAGGLLVTAPAAEDWDHESVGPALERFLAAAGPARERYRALMLARDLTASELAGYHAVLAVHAEGSLEAERLAVLRRYDLDRARALARRLAGA